jgi:hypothetical protein
MLGRFIEGEPEFYVWRDHGHTAALALDVRNDPSIRLLRAHDPRDNSGFEDWCIPRNYTDSAFLEYVRNLAEILDKRVEVVIEPSEGRDGYIGRLRMVKPDDGLIDFFQAEALQNISPRSILVAATDVSLPSGISDLTTTSLPIVRVVTNKQYSPLLLSYYFSAIKEDNPLKSFMNFYNVLEYYFEDAPTILNRSARSEREQLAVVLELATKNIDVDAYIDSLGADDRQVLAKDMATTTGISIPGISFGHGRPLREQLARWLYEIRCAIVHSKRTRRGGQVPLFEPYSEQANAMRIALPIARWLAVQCIEMDYRVTNTDEHGT